MSDRVVCERCKGMRDISLMVGDVCMYCWGDERMEREADNVGEDGCAT